ncbi:MAG: mandelate racemase/muconate lactonizing enzyme family protein [Acidobacteria bacterium]|nr:mandelate racemase/muconate lactonizing enzyme family protein [Acidobacteriota bacterium]
MNRREFLASFGSAAALAGCTVNTPPDRAATKITVTGIEIFRIHVNQRGDWVIPRIQTSAGVTGIGDASHAGAGEPQIAKLEEYTGLMKGRSIYDIEWLRQKVHPEFEKHQRATSCALSGIEQALYDIQGKVAGVPTYQLFGGKLQDTVRNYANINRSTDERTPQGFEAMARSAVEAGFDAIKMAPFDGLRTKEAAAEREGFTQLGIDCVAAVRGVLGPDGDLLVDAHSNFDLEKSLDLVRRLEPLKLFWLEEVSRSLEELAAINLAASMPTAGGEMLFGLESNARYIAAKAVDILMPDVKYCGGMLELKKISAMAEAAGLSCSPHGPASPVGNMAAAHVCVGLPNFLILEFSHGEVPWRAELMDPPEVVEEGYLSVTDRPGLGYELNETVARKYAVA